MYENRKKEGREIFGGPPVVVWLLLMLIRHAVV
jgi:hypothetical protein